MKNDNERNRFDRRTGSYVNFKKFLSSPNQKGDTLISSSPFIFKATKSLAAKRAYVTRLAYNPGAKIAANSLLIPTEVCWAANFVPFNWEMYSSLVASHSNVIELTNKGSAPVPRCSFINALKGSVVEEILPVPDIALSSSAFCEGIGHMMGELTQKMDVPHYHIDIPGYHNEKSLNYLSGQLKNIYEILCEHNNILPGQREQRIRQTYYNSVAAKIIYQEIFAIRKNHGPLNMGLEPLHWHTLFSPVWGHESAIDIFQRLKDEILEWISVQLKQGEQQKGLPVALYGLMPYGKTRVWKDLKERNAFVTFEGVNYLGEIVLPELKDIPGMGLDDIFSNMAYNLMHAPVRGLDVKDKAGSFIKNAVESKARGIVIFSHEHCQMLAHRLHEYEDVATKQNLKFVSISGDCILGMPVGPTGIRLGTFLNELENSGKSKGVKAMGSREFTFNGHNPELRIGLDFGSGFSKYVAIDRKNSMVKSGLFQSGIDYPFILNETLRQLSRYNELSITISGIGSENSTIQQMAQHYTTEINALITAVKFLYHSYNSFMVIDIGTQDVKILKFHNIDDNPWINTNKSCGAGTGMVLVQILDRWKQSDPAITFSDLDIMAFGADREELINTTCGIFAITNVVSALVQSDTEGKKNILRGVYQYVANQALKLLPNEVNNDIPLLLVGGLAGHNTLRKIFIEKGFSLLDLPEGLSYQHLVAYGSALSCVGSSVSNPFVHEKSNIN